MNVVFDTSFSPLLKLEEPYDSWWLDWYPCGNQKSESCLQKYREAQQEAAGLLSWDKQDIKTAPSSPCQAPAEESQSPPSEVPCMALDLEHEIAVLEEKARSNTSVELSLYDDEIAFMAEASKPLSHVTDVTTAAACGPVVTIPTCNVARRSYKLKKNPAIAPKPEVEDTQACSNQLCSTGFADSHSSEDDNATYASSALDNSSAGPPTLSPFNTISLSRKSARHPLKPTSTLPTSISTNNAAALVGSFDMSDDGTALALGPAGGDPSALSPLKRGRAAINAQAAVGKAKRRRGEAPAGSPRGQAGAMNDTEDEISGLVSQGSIAGLGAAPGSGTSRVTEKVAEKSMAVKGKAGKGKGAKGGAGSPRGRKRVVGRPAAPTPGAHSCSQCGAQSTPVWRAGPCGPKTLCNACGVRYMKVAKKK